MRHHPFSLPLLALGAAACDSPEATAPESCALVAAGPSTPIEGDANGDGFTDISDVLYLERHMFAGGPAPACDVVVDILTDDFVDAGDGFVILSYLFSGGSTSLATGEDNSCAPFTRATGPGCGDGLALGVKSPASVAGTAGSEATFPATVTLSSPTLPVEAWSFGVSATGCSITSSSVQSTIAADSVDVPAGLRRDGYAWVSPTVGASTASAVILGWRDRIVREGQAAPSDVLELTVSAPVGTSCAPCVLSLTNDVPGPNVAVEAVVSAGGYRYAPALGSVSVDICPG